MARYRNGFTLAELVIVLAVLSVLAGLAVPAFVQLARSARTHAALHAVTASFATARIAAISQGKPVTVCPSADGLHCRRDLAWEEGWIIFLDPSKTAAPASSEQVLQQLAPTMPGMELRSTAGRHFVRFQPTGFSYSSNLTLRLCAQDQKEEIASVRVNNAGRSYVRRPAGPTACQ